MILLASKEVKQIRPPLSVKRGIHIKKMTLSNLYDNVLTIMERLILNP